MFCWRRVDRLPALQVVVQYESECKTKEKHRSGQRAAGSGEEREMEREQGRRES